MTKPKLAAVPAPLRLRGLSFLHLHRRNVMSRKGSDLLSCITESMARIRSLWEVRHSTSVVSSGPKRSRLFRLRHLLQRRVDLLLVFCRHHDESAFSIALKCPLAVRQLMTNGSISELCVRLQV
jgi:hypothetical protein